ncbi:MAG TPA: protein kinase [Gemmatirosa sp.]
MPALPLSSLDAESPPAGVRAGGYVLEGEIGRGGMATVYLANDARHDRRVAVKVLAGALTAMLGADRFVHEVRVTARLQHPHILALLDSGVFGPDAGVLAGRPYYVMPYVEGPSLRAQIQREGPLPVAEAVRIAREVGAALAYAHRQGVVHRDIKPENILLQEGHALVADFGIALALEQAGGKRLTQTGFAVGTPPYMAPEQIMGDRQITARSDVYALGAVTYEMLVGEPPFTGPTMQAVVARVMTESPVLPSTRRPTVPPELDAVVYRALEKLPGDRYAGTQEFADALGQASAPRTSGDVPIAATTTGPNGTRTGPAATAAPAVLPRRARARDPLVLALAAAALLGTGAAAYRWSRDRSATPPRPVRFVVGPAGDVAAGGEPTLTPDGGTVVLAGAGEGAQLEGRALDDLGPRPLAGTEGARNPFVSPDGQWVAFTTANGELQRVPLDGAAPARVFTTGVSPSAEGVWGPGGTIIVDGGPFGGLARVDTTAAVRRPLTTPDTARGEQSHAAPRLLPDGRGVVFTVLPRAASSAASELAVVSLGAPGAAPAAHTRLGVSGRAALGVVDDHLLYVTADGSAIVAVPFDQTQYRVTGAPTVVLRDVTGTIDRATLAADGTLLYTRGAASQAVVLVDAHGAGRPIVAAAGDVHGQPMHPRVSPDGRRLALQVPRSGGQYDIWTYDLASGTPTRLTSGMNVDGPEWTPDGRHIVFTATNGGQAAFWSQAADGSAPARQLGDVSGFDATVTPDGRTLVFMRKIRDVWSIWSTALDGDSAAHTVRPVLTGPHDFYMPAISPDGRWLAYVSTESGRDEVYVRPFPGPGAAVRVSDGGGVEPLWGPGGRRLFYRAAGQFVAASVARGAGAAPSFVVADRTPLFRDTFDGSMPHANYAVAADGRHFVMLGGAARAPDAVLVANWLPEVRALLAGRK